MRAGPSAPQTIVEQAPKIHHPAEVHQDRDGKAVIAALHQLDVCALLDPVAVAAAGFPRNLKPWAIEQIRPPAHLPQRNER